MHNQDQPQSNPDLTLVDQAREGGALDLALHVVAMAAGLWTIGICL